MRACVRYAKTVQISQNIKMAHCTVEEVETKKKRKSSKQRLVLPVGMYVSDLAHLPELTAYVNTFKNPK